MKWYVHYTVMDEKVVAGPYATEEDARWQKEDIQGFEGVSQVWMADYVATGYKLLYDSSCD